MRTILASLIALLVAGTCAATCVPDDTQYWTTANLSWQPVAANPHVDGYRIYWRVPPNILWTLGAVVPCRHEVDEITGQEIHVGQVCQGEALPGQTDQQVFGYPARRIGDWVLTEVDCTVTAYNALGESLALSTPLSICMSPLCGPGEPCE